MVGPRAATMITRYQLVERERQQTKGEEDTRSEAEETEVEATEEPGHARTPGAQGSEIAHRRMAGARVLGPSTEHI